MPHVFKVRYVMVMESWLYIKQVTGLKCPFLIKKNFGPGMACGHSFSSNGYVLKCYPVYNILYFEELQIRAQ